MRIIERQGKVVTVTETKYRDRIQKIYVQGATIASNIPTYVQPADAELFAVAINGRAGEWAAASPPDSPQD